uniref:Candidate secreted effector n=1 Tax=Meloidogyne incognita TaxID=6306 RepID=A0A914N0R8_MELIC
MSFNNNTTTNNSVPINSSLNILDKVKQFLPQIAEANEKLKNDETTGSVLIEKFEEESSNISENETSSSEDSDEVSNEDFCDSDDELQPKSSNEESKQFVQFDVHLFEEDDENNKGNKLVMETSYF